MQYKPKRTRLAKPILPARHEEPKHNQATPMAGTTISIAAVCVHAWVMLATKTSALAKPAASLHATIRDCHHYLW